MKLSRKQQKKAIQDFARKQGWSTSSVKNCTILRYKAYAFYMLKKA